MPRLLQINIEVNSGSTGRIAEQIGEIAISSGWESYITYARGYQPSKSNVIKIGNYFNILIHVLQTRLFDNHCKSSSLATRKLIKKIEEIKPDLIHLHQLHGYYLNIEILFNYLSRISTPVVWTMHDCWGFTGHCTNFTLIGCEKWRTECHHCPKKKFYPKSIFLDRSKANFILKKRLFTSVENLTIVAVSDWLRNLIKESFLSGIQTLTINNGVDTDRFRPYNDNGTIRKKYGIGDRFVILGVGTEWNFTKGLLDYYKLREKLSDDFSIMLVGVSSKIIKKLPRGITGVPRTENIEELARIYSMADVVTSLSYQEAFGLTPIEGFACGTPAIVYNATALPELVTSDVGYIVEPGNIDQLISAIKKVQQKGKSYYTVNCRTRAENHYSKVKKYKEYILLYKKLLKQE